MPTIFDDLPEAQAPGKTIFDDLPDALPGRSIFDDLPDAQPAGVGSDALKFGYGVNAGLQGVASDIGRGAEALSDIGPFQRTFGKHLRAEQQAAGDLHLPALNHATLQFAPRDPEGEQLGRMEAQHEIERSRIQTPAKAFADAAAEKQQEFQQAEQAEPGPKLIGKLGEVTGQTAGYVAPAAVPWAGPAIGATTAGLASTGATYEQALKAFKDAGDDDETARQKAERAAGNTGAASALIFATPVGELAALPKSGLAKLLASAGIGAAQMSADNLQTLFKAKADYDPDLTLGDILKGTGESAVTGALLSGLLHGAAHAGEIKLSKPAGEKPLASVDDLTGGKLDELRERLEQAEAVGERPAHAENRVHQAVQELLAAGQQEQEGAPSSKSDEAPKLPPLIPGEKLVTVQRPDGSTYQASWSGAKWSLPDGTEFTMIGRPAGDHWSHAALEPGEKIIGGTEGVGQADEPVPARNVPVSEKRESMPVGTKVRYQGKDYTVRKLSQNPDVVILGRQVVNVSDLEPAGEGVGQASPTPLTESVKSETNDQAAPETETGATAEPETLETPATRTPAEQAAPVAMESNPIPVEGGESPSRSAAAPRTRRTENRPWDLLDEIEGQIGTVDPTLIKEANPNWKPIGAARKIFKKGGTPADAAAAAMAESGHYSGDPNQVDQFAEAANDAANARKGFRTQAAKEKRQVTQDSAFARDVSRPGPDQKTMVADDLQPGDTLKIRGAPFKVRHLEFDEDGNVSAVTLDDGAKYGTQIVAGGTELKVDKRSFHPTKEPVITQPMGEGRLRSRLAREGEEGTVPQRDKFLGFLDEAIERTKPKTGLQTGEVSMGLFKMPVWLTQEALHGALKIVRAAYKGGLRLADAVQKGVAWLREQNLDGFDPDEAHVALLHALDAQNGEIKAEETAAPARTETGKSYQGLSDRREEISKRLTEIEQERRRGGMTDALKGERWRLQNESRDVQRRLLRDLDYVRDLLRRMNALHDEMARARDAGNGLKVREAGDELRGLMEGEWQNVPEDLRSRIYSELVARGEIMSSAKEAAPPGRTLGGLTAWLDARKLDSPKLKWRERFSLAKRLADEWAKGKDAASKAWATVRSGWRAFVDQYKAPPSDDDFRSVMKDWFFEKQWTGLETHKWIQAIRKQVPSVLRRQAISAWLDAGGDRALLQERLDHLPAKWKPIWRTALELTPGEISLAREIRNDFEHKMGDALNVGLIKRGREEYGVPQLWNKAPEAEGDYNPFEKKQTARRTGAQLDPRDPFFSMRRTVPSYFDGIMHGGTPKSLDIGDLVAVYNADFLDALADRGVIKALKDVKTPAGDPIVMISGTANVQPMPNGGRAYFIDSRMPTKEAVTDDGRGYQFVDHWALKGWKYASRDAAGNPVLVHGDFLVHPDYVGWLKNELGNSILRDPNGPLGSFAKVTNRALKSAAYLKASKFASATFHGFTLAEHSLFHAFAGKPSAERFKLLWPSVRGVQIDPLRDPEVAGLMRNGTQFGFDGQRELFEEGLASHGGIWGKVPYLSDAMRRTTDFIFQRYLPALKIKTGKAILHANLDRYRGKLTEDQIYELTANQVNAAFGGQNRRLAWTAMGRNKTLLDVNRLMLTAPDFLISRSKVVAQALKPYNAEQRYFLMAQAALVYTAARALNMLLDKDPHWEANQAFRVVYNGRSYGARFLVSDIQYLLSEPTAFAAGRVGPLGRTFIETITQRDMRTGTRVPVPIETHNVAFRAAEVALSDMGRWLIPIGTEGLLPGAKGREETGPGQVALALSGVGSWKYTPESQVWTMVDKFERGSHDPATQRLALEHEADVHEASDYRTLDDYLDAGKLNMAADEYRSLIADGHKPASIAARYRVYSADGELAHPFTGSHAREAQFLGTLSAGERRIYQNAVQLRVKRQREFQRMVRAAR